MRDPISVGIVGIGYGQHVLAPAFAADERCKVAAICARTADRAEAVARRLRIPRALGDWRALVADPEVDAVAIAVPPALQAPLVLAAAAAGKAVFCEKPVAATVSQARAMLRAVEDAGVAHAVDFIFPEIAAWKRASQIIRGGELGTLRQFDLSWKVETYAHRTMSDSWKLRNEEGGGTLNNFVSHSLYYLEWLFGPIVKLAARLASDGGPGDARVDVWLEFKGGLCGSISVAANAFLGPGHRLDVYGEHGTLVLENRSADHASGFQLWVGTRQSPALTPVVCEDPAGVTSDGRVMATGAIVRRFLDAVLTGSALEPNLADGLRVQRWIERIRAADEREIWQTETGGQDSDER
jgi:predicted dehydrogenase